MISQFQQFVHHPDGRITIQGHPEIELDVIQEQGSAQGEAIERELGLPTYFEEWEELAKPQGLSGRMVRFVLADESVTRLHGSPRLQPKKITLPPTALCHLEFGHRGFVVGVVSAFFLGDTEHRDDLKQIGLEVPSFVEGDCILAQAQLFASPLADKAWEAIARGIFTHVCPALFRNATDPLGTGRLVEVSLTSGDYPGCPGARILKAWEV